MQSHERAANDHRPTVLVIDDDAAARELFSTAVRTTGCEVVTGENGLDALYRIGQSVPDAIVLDLDLPRLSGVALIVNSPTTRVRGSCR